MLPRTIHFVWPAGDGKPLPDLYRLHMQQWAALNPDFDVRLWDGSEFPEARFHRERDWQMRACSDEIRFRALHRDGGFYFDLDIQPLRPIPDWMVEAGGFLHQYGRYLCPAAIAMPRQHSAAKAMIACVDGAKGDGRNFNIGWRCVTQQRSCDLVQLPARYFLSRDPKTAIYGVHGVRAENRRNPMTYLGDPRPDPIKDRPCCDPPSPSNVSKISVP